MLTTRLDGSVLNVTLNRPEVRNAFNEELIAALAEVFANPGEARAIVLRGEGASFCAGGDLQWMQRAASYTHEQNVQDALNLARMLEAAARCPAIVIAKVQGAAFGGGCGLVAACDVAVAIDGTKFSFSEVKLGLIPATICNLVVQKIGQGHARALFTTGEVFGTDKAHAIGLVHEIATDPHDAEKLIEKKLEAVLMAGPRAVGKAKHLVLDWPYSLEAASSLLADARASDEGKEGIDAFLNKRAASFVEKLV